MMVKKFLLFLAGAALIAGLFGACRQHCGHHGMSEKKANYIVKYLAKKLDLDDAQKAKLDAIKADVVAKLATLKGTRKAVQAEFIAQFSADSFDSAKVGKLFESKEKEWIETRKFLTGKLAELHAMLKSEQRKKLAALIEERTKACDKE